MQRHGDGVLDIKKIPLLFAVAKIGTVALEQPDAPWFAPARNFCGRATACHPCGLVRAEDVEVFQPDDLV